MATKDGFNPDHPLPVFLCDHEPDFLCDDEPIGNGRAVISLREQNIGNDRGVISLQFVLASILVATATATGISILSAGNPVTLFADLTAPLADKSVPQPGADQSTAIIQSVLIQSTADAEALPPAPPEPVSQAKKDTDEESAGQTKKETGEAASEALFKEFQVWNAEQDARAKPVQNDPALVAKNASASVRPMQKHRLVRTTRTAKAEMIGHVRERRANVRRQNEQAQTVLDARAQAQDVQYAQQPSFLESLNPFRASRPLY